MAVQRDNPYLNFNFLVDLGLGEEMGFSEVEVPSGEIEQDTRFRGRMFRKKPGDQAAGSVRIGSEEGKGSGKR